MKTSIITLALTITTMLSAFAQKSSLTFFSQEGERFYVVLNGIRQNDKPSANVTVTDLNLPTYKAKIIFESPALGSIDKSLYLQDADGNFADLVYNIRKDKKGVYILRLSGYSEVASSSASPKADVVVYHAEETSPAATTPAPVETVKQTTTTTTTTKPTSTTTYQENVNMNLGGLGFGVNVNSSVTEDADGNVNMNVNMGGLNNVNTNATVKQTTTTTTTTTTKTTTNPAVGQPVPAATPVAATPPVKEVGCVRAVSSTDFAAGKKSITSSSFSETQMKTAKTFTKNNCLSVAQIKDIMGLFSFEASKLDYAKYAYDFCVDKKNYYQLTEAFSFSSSSDDLNEFLETK